MQAMNSADECQEEAELIQIRPNAGAPYSQAIAARRGCRLIDLSVTLLSGSGTFYVYVADGIDVLDGNGNFKSGSVLKLNPKAITSGSTVSWSPPTKWTPFDGGISVVISADGSSATNASFDCFKHIIYNR